MMGRGTTAVAVLGSLLLPGLLANGCGTDDSMEPGQDITSARLQVTLQAEDFPGLASVKIKIRDHFHDCGDPGVREAVLPVSDAASPVHVFFVLPADTYTICLEGLDAMGNHLNNCAGGVIGVTVAASTTTEVSTFLSCRANQGGLDVTVGINHSPEIEHVDLDPGTSITVCQTAELSAVASDVEGDALSFEWFVARNSSNATVTADGAHATFRPLAVGEFTVMLFVRDARRGFNFLEIPFHVAACQ